MEWCNICTYNHCSVQEHPCDVCEYEEGEIPSKFLAVYQNTNYDSIKTQLDEGAYLPERAHHTDAGADLKTPKRVVLPPHNYVVIDTGIHVEIPEGYAGHIKSKSGLMVNYGIFTHGLVDCGYSGSIRVALFNFGHEYKMFEPGDKIAQLEIVPVITPKFVQVDKITGGERADNGFGSTGR